MKAGAHVNFEYGQWSPLSGAASRGYNDIVEILLDAGADVNHRHNCDWMPLHYAVYFRDSPETVLTLLKHEANINGRTKDGSTPLMLAVCFSKAAPIVKVLIEAGVDQTIPDNKGHLPIQKAIKYKFMDIVALLKPAFCACNTTIDTNSSEYKYYNTYKLIKNFTQLDKSKRDVLRLIKVFNKTDKSRLNAIHLIKLALDDNNLSFLEEYSSKDTVFIFL